jgi:hypothetical protein
MKCRHCFAVMRTVAAGAVTLALSTPVLSAPVDESIPIEDLLKTGWQVAGYTSTFDNRSAFILFGHPDESYLVQCRAGYDVTRSPRTYSNCYELR